MKRQIKYIFILLLVLNNILSYSQSTETKKNDSIFIETDWFEVTKIDNLTYAITEPKSAEYNTSYLIIGNNRAILFDSGTGENEADNGTKIKHIIEQITNLPVTIIVSHFHYDHIRNIKEFDRVAFPDLSFLRKKVGLDSIYFFSEEEVLIDASPKDVFVNEWLSINKDFDLGNRLIRILHIPGHSSESIAIIDQKNNLTFLGDFLYNGALFIYNSENIDIYLESIKKLLSIITPDYKLYGAHGKPEISYTKLNTLKELLNRVKDNQLEFAMTQILGYPTKAYKYNDMNVFVVETR